MPYSTVTTRIALIGCFLLLASACGRESPGGDAAPSASSPGGDTGRSSSAAGAAAERAGAPAIDACKLYSTAEAEALIRAPVHDVRHYGAALHICSYSLDIEEHGFTFQVEPLAPWNEPQVVVRALEGNGQSFTEEVGLGDRALLTADGDATLLHTWVKGYHILVVTRLRERRETEQECARKLTGTLITRI